MRVKAFPFFKRHFASMGIKKTYEKGIKSMRIWKNFFRSATVIGLAVSLSAVSLIGIPTVYAASSHSKIEDGIYQLRDGTAIPGIFARGIDVSHWQGTIDWEQVANNDVSFVMLGTRYNGQVDPRFHTNATEAVNHGIQIGIYIYSYAVNTAMAEAEADFVLNLIKDYPVSYPVAFDVEASVQSTLSPLELANIINAFCRKIENAGYHAILYANDYWLANKIDMSQVDYDVWVARYENKHAFENPVMWQATSTGAIDGITGNVDIDFQFRDFSDVILPNLWRTIGGSTYYYQNHRMQKNNWIHDGTGWFYMDGNGIAANGWLTQNDSTYYLEPDSGRMVSGWKYFEEGWRYFNDSGVMQSGWIQDGNVWYYLNQDALMETGWLSDGGTWYYLKESGAMTDGWRQIDGIWFYFNGSGIMQIGQQQIDNNWYYFGNNGAMLTGLQRIDNNLHYFDENGAMATGLRQINDNWYYFSDSDGIMATGWRQINGVWYYFGDDGTMQTGWIGDSSARYYLNPENGAMYTNTQIIVDGITYNVDSNGVCQEVNLNSSDNQNDAANMDEENVMENISDITNAEVIENIIPFGS